MGSAALVDVKMLHYCMEEFEQATIHCPEWSLANKEYVARVVDIYDGDTITCVMRAPGEDFHKYRIRLAGIDTPEIKDVSTKEIGMRAKARMYQLITGLEFEKGSRKDMIASLDKEVYLVRLLCDDFEKYGRLLAKVITVKGDIDVGETLVQEGLAYRYQGGTKKKFDSTAY